MSISCDHPRPKLVLPSYTPPKLNWQVPAFLPDIPPNSARAILEALRGIYNEMLKRFAEPTIVPLIEDTQARPGQVIKGVGAGQTITLVPPGFGELLDPITIVLTAMSSPVKVAMPDGTEVTLSNPGVYTVFPDDDNSYQIPPGDIGLVGIQGVSAGTQLMSSGTLSFANSNGVIFGLSNSSVLTADVDAIKQFRLSDIPSSIISSLSNATDSSITNRTIHLPWGSSVASQNSRGNVHFVVNSDSLMAFARMGVTAPGGGFLLTGLQFSDANSVSWGIATSTNATGRFGIITATVSDPGLLISHVGGNSAPNALSLAFSNASGVTFSLSTAAAAATLLASVNDQSIGLVSHVGGNVASSVTQLVFSNASNITWSLSTAAGAVTVIASAGAGGSSSAATEGIILDPTEVLNFVRTSGTWDLETSHIDSDGTLGSTTTAAAVATTALATAPGALDRTIVECSIYCSSAGTFSVTAGGVTVLGPLSLTAGERVEFTSAQGWRVFNADGSEKSAAAGGGGGAAISAAGNSVSAGTVVWSNSNNVSFGMAGSTITATATFASSQGIINFSAGTTSGNLSNVIFSNVNNVSFGLNGSTVTASVVAPRLLDIVASTGTASSGTLHFTNNTLFTGDISLMTNNVVFQMIGNSAMHAHAPMRVTANLASTQTGGFLVTKLNFLNSNNVTWGVATELDGEGRAAIITASVAAGGGGGGITRSGLDQYGNGMLTQLVGFPASNTMRLTLCPIELPSFQFDRLVFPVRFSLTTSTHSGTYRVNVGVYTRNVSTLSRLHSTTFSIGVTVSTGNTSLFQGTGLLTIPWTSTITDGQYWLGVALGSTSAGANASMSFMRLTVFNSSGATRIFGAASNNSIQAPLGLGAHTVTNTSVPSSIAFSDMQGVSTEFRQPPYFFFQSGTA